MSIKREQIQQKQSDQIVAYQNPLPINIKILIQDQNGKLQQEFIQSFLINQCVQDPSLNYNSPIILKKLLLELKNQMNFSLQSNFYIYIFLDKEIYFYIDKANIFMNCGIDPINEDIKIRSQDYKNKQFITIKAKDLGISMVHRLMTFQNTFGNNGQQKEKGGVDQMAQRSKCRRTKQRRIGHIIDKVIQWRKNYIGGVNDKNVFKKYSLEDAARQVQISKKSLDDYLFQIREGQKYGFNFNQHYNDKVGVLRDYVRQRKKNDKYDFKTKKVVAKGQQKEDIL